MLLTSRKSRHCVLDRRMLSAKAGPWPLGRQLGAGDRAGSGRGSPVSATQQLVPSFRALRAGLPCSASQVSPGHSRPLQSLDTPLVGG